MKVLDNISDKQLDMLIRMLAIAVTVIALAIAGLYIRERYMQSNVSVADRAEQQLTDLVKKDPENITNRLDIANTYYMKGKFDDAITQYNEALKVDPSNVGAIFGLGISYAGKGQDTKAAGYLESIVEMSKSPQSVMLPTDPRMNQVNYLLGKIYSNQGRTDDAIEAFKAAYANDPGDADSLRLLGDAYLKKGELDGAQAAYTDALKYVPDFGEAYDGLQKVYQQKGDKNMSDWAKGMAAMSKKDYDGAIQTLTALVNSSPDFAAAYYGLGRCYEAKNDKVKAYGFYKKAADLDPDGQQDAAELAKKLEVLVQ